MDKPHIRVVAAEIERDGRYIITQRRAEASMPLLWEFPGGRVEPGESDTEALVRELRDRLGVDAVVEDLSLHVEQEYEHYTLDLLVYRASIAGEPRALRVRALRWVFPDEFDQYEFPGADQRTVDELLR